MMQGRGSKRVLSILCTPKCSRASSTAAQLKPRSSPASSNSASSLASETSQSTARNLGKWSRASEPSFLQDPSRDSSRVSDEASSSKGWSTRDPSLKRERDTGMWRLPPSDRSTSRSQPLSRDQDSERPRSGRWSTADSQSERPPNRGSLNSLVHPPKATPKSAIPEAGSSQQKTNKWTLEDSIIPSNYNTDNASDGVSRHVKYGRMQGRQHKTRGSYLSELGPSNYFEAPPAPSQPQQVNPVKKTKPKTRTPKVTRDVYIPHLISVENLSRLLNIRLGVLLRRMRAAGMDAESSYDYMLSSDLACLLAEDCGYNPIVDDSAAFDIYPLPFHPNSGSLPLRPPVVTIMGHVDHGKTTLLDTLRSTSVAKGEAGGITQHIGAFSVQVKSVSTQSSNTITFLDTPGHAAFSSMRSRGALVTDIIVLVVAADDGVMPQTKEVIELIKKDRDHVGVVVAINKVDKPGVDIEAIQTALWAAGIELEALGGDVPSVEVSGLTGHGLDQLVETISAVAEIRDLRAEVDVSAHGYILESKVQPGIGVTATVLLRRGSLKPSDFIISGTTYAKVRQLLDPTGKVVKNASPGTAVVVSGWKELPQAGNDVLGGSENDIKKACQNRVRKAQIESTRKDAESLNEQRRNERERKALVEEVQDATEDDPQSEPSQKELKLVIKGDVSGTVEALTAAVSAIGNKLACVKVVSTGVGDVTESDIMMAKTCDGAVVAFSVKIPRGIKVIASREGIPTFESSIIYQVLDDVKTRIIALLPVIKEISVVGEATVLQLFDIQLKNKLTRQVGGCRVGNGVVYKTHKARVIRNNQVIFEGQVDTLRVLKRDVTEVKKGSECGLSLVDFNDIRVNDTVQIIKEIEKPGQL